MTDGAHSGNIRVTNASQIGLGWSDLEGCGPFAAVAGGSDNVLRRQWDDNRPRNIRSHLDTRGLVIKIFESGALPSIRWRRINGAPVLGCSLERYSSDRIHVTRLAPKKRRSRCLIIDFENRFFSIATDHRHLFYFQPHDKHRFLKTHYSPQFIKF